MNILKHRVDSSSPDASMVVRNDQEAVSFSRDHANMPGQRVLLKENKYAYVVWQFKIGYFYIYPRLLGKTLYVDDSIETFHFSRC